MPRLMWHVVEPATSCTGDAKGDASRGEGRAVVLSSDGLFWSYQISDPKGVAESPARSEGGRASERPFPAVHNSSLRRKESDPSMYAEVWKDVEACRGLDA